MVACGRVGGTEGSSMCMGAFEGGCHYLHYLHHKAEVISCPSETGLGVQVQDGGVEGRALIFSCENSKVTTCC